MLPAPARMRRGAEFTATMRRGSRGTSRAVSVHLALPDPAGATNAPARVGLVVGRPVGSAVVRNGVRRRLRHLLRARLASLPSSSSLVVRAHPVAASLPSDVLAVDLDRALRQALDRLRARR
jgi:ribonuclease P protein component